MATLTYTEIIQALKHLGILAHAQNHTVELIVVGGAAMVLQYNARPATQDVDALIISPQAHIVRDLAQKVAESHNLPPDWLNDGAKGYLIGLTLGETVFSAPGIVVKTPAPAQLLAMKLSAWRDDVDIADAARLLQTFSNAKDQVWTEVSSYLIPGAELKACYAFLDLWEDLYGSD